MSPHPLLDGPAYPEEFAARYRAAGYWTGDVFADFADRGAHVHGAAPAVSGVDHAGTPVTWSHAELAEAAAATGAGLTRAGIAAGDAVIVQLPNIVEYVAVVLGLFRIGAIPVFALPAHRRSELTQFRRIARARGYVTAGRVAGCDHRGLADELIADARAAGADAPVTVVVDADGGGHTRLRDLADLADPAARAAAAAAAGPPAPADPEDLALIQLSGGTTGTPKLIPRTHAAYHYSIRASAGICRCGPGTRMLAVLPAAHNFTMSSPGILGVLWAGGEVILSPTTSPRRCLELVERHRVTDVALVPPLAMAWIAALDGSGADVSSLRVIQVGGAKFTESAARRLTAAFDCRLQQVFGMAEGLVNYTRDTDPPELALTTQGRPISAADEIRILGEDGAEVAEGEPGRLTTRGPYTIRGYLGGADPGSFDEEGFYASGDVVRRLPGGHLVVEGRVKDQVNRGGEKFAAEEVENHLIAHPGILDAVVVAVPDPRLGEKSCAVLVADRELDPAEVRAFVRARGVAAYKVPDRVVLRDALPTTGVGKISRRELRERLAAELAGADAG